MDDKDKSKEQLLSKVLTLRQRNIHLEEALNELKRSKYLMLSSSDEWELTFDAMPDLIAIIDTDYRIVRINKAMAEKLGITKSEAIGLTCYKHIHGCEAPLPSCPHTLMLADGKGHFSDMYIEQLGGAYIVSVSPLRNDLGHLIGCVHVARDYHERKQAEEALRQSEARFKMITDNMNDTIWLMDLNFKLTWISSSVERKRGYSLEELNALPLEKHLTPSSLDIALKTLSKGLDPEIFQRKELDLSTTLELEYFKKDGSTYWSEVKFSLLRDWEGAHVCVLGVGRDITERKRAEEALNDNEQRLLGIIQGSPIPTFVIGKDHRVVYWNRALEELSGIKAEEVIGTMNQWRAFYGKKRPCMADLLVDQMHEVIPRWYFEKYIKSRLIEDAYEATDFFQDLGDSGKWLRFTAAIIRDSQGEPVGAIETLEDITEREQAKDILERLVQERTSDLSNKNVQLINEIKERKQAETELKKRKKELETKTTKLEELNTTLKILLMRRDEDKKETEEKVMSNIKNIIIPHIDKLKNRRLDEKTMFHVRMVESNLLDIISPFSHTLSSKYIYMTPREIQVANLVKEGKSTKEIAEMMDVSSYAIELHRFNIRRKLGLKSRKINLKSYLLSIS